MEESFVVTHNGERQESDRKQEGSENVEGQTEVGEKATAFRSEGSGSVAIGLAACLRENSFVCGNDGTVGTDRRYRASIRTEDQPLLTHNVIHETIEVQEKDVFDKESIPPGNRLNVVFKCEESWWGRLDCNGMVETGHKKVGMGVQVDWCGVWWQREDCHAWLGME